MYKDHGTGPLALLTQGSRRTELLSGIFLSIESSLGLCSNYLWSMWIRHALAGIGCAVLFWATPAPALADDAPDWLRQAASVGLPTYDKSVPAVVLYDEKTTNVEPDGRFVTTWRRAVKVLNREGRAAAIAKAVYDTDMQKVRDI